MADNATFASIGLAAQANSSLGYEPGMITAAVPGTDFRGVGFAQRDDFLLSEVVKISNAATLTTGVKIDLCLVDDGADPSDLGKAVVFGATVKLLASGTDSLDMTAGAGAEQTATITLAATAGLVTIGSILIPTANLDSAAVGNHIAIQLRRIGTNAADTCRGRVIVLKATAYAY